MSCGKIIGVLLICIPIICFQLNPDRPLEREWKNDGQYHRICIFLGGIGGSLLALRGGNYLGYLWAGGFLGGMMTSALSYSASKQWADLVGGGEINIFLIILCAIPGLLVYFIIRRCSNYTFPYQSVPDTDYDRGSATDSDLSSSRSQTTPFIAYKV